MSQYKYAEIADTVYFWFAANLTTGAAGDGATPLYDVRLAGAAAGAIPTASGTPTLLTHANYTDGLHEIAIDTTGYAVGEYAVFCTLTISSVNPAGFCGSFKLRTAGTAALAVDAVAISGDATAADNCELMFDGAGYAGGTTKLKVDLDTVKTQAVTCAAGVTVLASVGTAATSTAQTGDSFPLVSTEVAEIYAAVITNAAGVDIAADIIALQGNVTTIMADTDLLDDVSGGLADIHTVIATLTTTVGAAGAGLTSANIGQAALVANNLDHLCLTATAGVDMTVEVADGTIISRIISNSDTSLYVPATSNLTTVGANVTTIDDYLDTELASITAAVITNAAGADIAADIIALKAVADDVLTDTAVIGALGAGLTAIPWNSAWDVEVESEVNDALVVQRLDEILNADSDIDGAAPPTVGSVIHELLTKTAGSFTYDQTTDSLEAIRDAGFSTLDAAGVRAAVGMTSANLDTQLADIPTVSEFNARTIPSADYVVTSDTIAGVTLVATCTTNTDMRGTDSAALAATALSTAVWTNARAAKLDTLGGAGAITWTYTLTDSTNSLPISDADIWVTSDIAGANILASGRTNVSGVVTFYLDAATVYIWRQKSGYNFTNPDTEVISA